MVRVYKNYLKNKFLITFDLEGINFKLFNKL